MRIRWLVAALTISLSIVSSLQAQPEVRFFPLSEVRPGLEGIGRTVFDGDKIEEFQVHILGVLKSVIGPKRSVILARLSGGRLRRTVARLGTGRRSVYVSGPVVGPGAPCF